MSLFQVFRARSEPHSLSLLAVLMLGSVRAPGQAITVAVELCPPGSRLLIANDLSFEYKVVPQTVMRARYTGLASRTFSMLAQTVSNRGERDIQFSDSLVRPQYDQCAPYSKPPAAAALGDLRSDLKEQQRHLNPFVKLGRWALKVVFVGKFNWNKREIESSVKKLSDGLKCDSNILSKQSSDICTLLVRDPNLRKLLLVPGGILVVPGPNASFYVRYDAIPSTAAAPTGP